MEALLMTLAVVASALLIRLGLWMEDNGRLPITKEERMKNLCAKTVKREDAYEVWQSADASWTWYVLKKWQADDNKPYARWFCDVVTPMVPDGEMGDVYVSEIKQYARRIK